MCRPITLRRTNTKNSIQTRGFSTTSANSRRVPPKPNCAVYWAVSCFRPMTSSNASACSPAASAIATLCCECFCIPQTFLLLDEPTNHLDMRAKDVLLKALMDYTGTVVFVSHDRYFIDKLATRVFEVGDGRVEVYPGNYEDYRWRKEGGAEKCRRR